jgi:hypothetical protein
VDSIAWIIGYRTAERPGKVAILSEGLAKSLISTSSDPWEARPRWFQRKIGTEEVRGFVSGGERQGVRKDHPYDWFGRRALDAPGPSQTM